MKKVPIAITRKIDLINSMLPKVYEAVGYPTTFAGGTWEHYVMIKSIKVKNQFVTIDWEDNIYNYARGKERFNVNKPSHFMSEYCVKHLNETLNIIIKSFKKVAYVESI